MVVETELSDAEVDAVFHALADRTRRDILARAMTTELSISALARGYEMSVTAVQKHVAVLVGAALVSKERRGREQLVRAEPAGLARAARVLDEYEALWRARIGRIDDLLAADPVLHAPSSLPTTP